MSCPKRPYKFLGIFSSHKPHVWKPEKIGKFMPYVGNYFILQETCPYCSISERRSFVTAEELMMKGYTLAEINEAKGIELY